MARLKKVFIFLPISSLLLVMFSPFLNSVNATEIVITGNGSDSTSEINTSIQATTEITQDNNADVNNAANVISITGENQSNGNSGDINIQTGSIKNEVKIDNNLNNSTVTTGCCDANEKNIMISDNGTDSVNSVSINSLNTNTTSVRQLAYISNIVSGYSDTGNNTANNNSGNVTIQTGNIDASSKIVNGPANIYKVNLQSGTGSFSAQVSGNGSGSKNNIIADLGSSNFLFLNNDFKADNFVIWDLNTGKNTALGNSGNVFIKTGNITFDSLIQNTANFGVVQLSCCKEKDDQNPPDNPNPPVDPGKPTPTPSPSGVGGFSVSSSSGSGVGGFSPAVLGLSATSNLGLGLIRLFLGFVIFTLGAIIVGQKLYEYKKILQLHLKIN